MIKIKEPLVSVDWLYENHKASNLIILDASIAKVTSDVKGISTEVKISNARFFDLKYKFSDVSSEFPNTFPSGEQFTEEAQKLGINSNSAIVIYDDKGIYSSPRAWWLFKTFGHANVAVLDGGLPEWQKAELHIENDQTNTILKGDFNADLQKGNMCFFNDIVETSTNNTKCILDARSAERFNCMVPEPRENLRGGTIPNSKNLPFATLLKDGKMKSKCELETIFKAIGDKDSSYVFSCGSGITACILALGATLSGRQNITVYDGSWTEYGSLV